MANKTLTCTVTGGGTITTVTPPTSSGSRIEMIQGDTLTLSVPSGTESIQFTGFSSTFWVSTSNVTVTVGNTSVRTLKLTGTGTGQITINPTGTGPTETFYFNVSAPPPPDDAPDSPYFSSISGAELSTEYSASYQVIGIDVASINISTSGVASFKINDGSYSTADKTAVLNDVITVKRTSSGLFNTTVPTVVTMGSASPTWNITTVPDLNLRSKYDFAITTVPISSNDIEEFFCGDRWDDSAPAGTANGNSNTLYRGGAYVPEITENAGVPTSGTKDFQDYLGVSNIFFFSKIPQFKILFGDTNAGGTTLTITWNIPSDINVGYSRYLYKRTEFKYDVVVRCAGGFTRAAGDITASGTTAYTSTTGKAVTITVTGTSAYSVGNTQVSLQAVVPTNTEGHFTFTATCSARPLDDISLVETTTASGRLDFYGP